MVVMGSWAVGAQGAAEAENLALNKSARASSIEGEDVLPGFAFDGNIETRWASGFDDNQWIYVDLGEAREIGRVVLNWENARAREYKLQISDEEKTWKDVTTVTDCRVGRMCGHFHRSRPGMSKCWE